VTTVYRTPASPEFPQAQNVHTRTLDLLPGAYRVLITIDGKAWPYPHVGHPTMESYRVDRTV